MDLERDHYTVLYAIGELHGRGLVALEIKTYDNLFCGHFGQILHQRKISCYTSNTIFVGKGGGSGIHPAPTPTPKTTILPTHCT